MILPSDEECRRVISELESEPNLTPWEADFIESNAERYYFSDLQKDAVAKLKDKFDV